MKALIVDDSMINLKVAKKLIEHEGLIVDTSISGKDCLEKVKTNNYDIIFMDIMMPEMDGVETFKKLVEQGINIPVVTLTADAEMGAKEKYLNLGFYDYISKPIDVALLRSIIKRVKIINK